MSWDADTSCLGAGVSGIPLKGCMKQMKIVRMNTSSFWKGEAGVKGLVEDQGETFEVNLYLGS